MALHREKKYELYWGEVSSLLGHSIIIRIFESQKQQGVKRRMAKKVPTKAQHRGKAKKYKTRYKDKKNKKH